METRKLQDAEDETRVLEEHWAWLVPVHGDGAGQVVVVKSSRMTVGSDPTCGLHLRGETVAAVHVVLERKGRGRWTLTEHAGEKRTKIDGDWLGSGQEFEVQDGARIEIGSLALVFKCVG